MFFLKISELKKNYNEVWDQFSCAVNLKQKVRKGVNIDILRSENYLWKQLYPREERAIKEPFKKRGTQRYFSLSNGIKVSVTGPVLYAGDLPKWRSSLVAV